MCVEGQKRHPDSNGETVKRRSPVCVFTTSKGHIAAGLDLMQCDSCSDQPLLGAI